MRVQRAAACRQPHLPPPSPAPTTISWHTSQTCCAAQCFATPMLLPAPWKWPLQLVTCNLHASPTGLECSLCLTECLPLPGGSRRHSSDCAQFPPPPPCPLSPTALGAVTHGHQGHSQPAPAALGVGSAVRCRTTVWFGLKNYPPKPLR